MSNNGCGQLGAVQTRGTCWFFSIINGFILSEDGQKILYQRLQKFYKSLTINEKTYFDDKFNAPCPMKNLVKTKEIYFWKFIDQYLCFMSGPREIALRAGKSASILDKLSLQGTLAKQHGGGKGAHPQVEIAKIMNHIGFKDDYYTLSTIKGDATKFDARCKPKFVVCMYDEVGDYKYMNMPEIPIQLLRDKDYSLTCASIVIANTKAKSSAAHRYHAVAGYMCNGKGYIYDSNQEKIFRCDWWDRANLKKVIDKEVSQFYSYFKGGKVDLFAYAFAIFTRKGAIAHVAPTCRMKYTTKTPHFYGNFTDPNLGKKLNRGNFGHFKPAQIAALKRRWALTEHKYKPKINKVTLKAILNSATSKQNGFRQVVNLQNAGYSVSNENFKNFQNKIKTKFPSPVNPFRTKTFAEAKALLSNAKGITARKRVYSEVWSGLPMHQRKVLMHFRNKGVWLVNNAFAKSPVKSVSRATKLKANFEAYWQALQPNNRKMLRNYIATHKTPSPPKPKPKSPSALNAAKRNVNALTTAKARKEYQRKRAVDMSMENWKAIKIYIARKNYEAQKARAAKKSVAKK